MAVFSKLSNYLNLKMWFAGDFAPPLSVSTVLSAFVICIVSFYLFKWISGEGQVPIRDSTKNHSWTSIQIAAKVTITSTIFINIIINIILGLVLLNMRGIAN